jgi:endonuclease/exonuclease/phosphatase family metal-dependent hydrolase
LKKLLLLVFIVIVIVVGIFTLRKEPENQPIEMVPPTEFRIMTYNIHHGVGTDGMYSLSRIVGIIREQAPQIVCLNEVDFETERTYRDNQARIIAAELGMEFTFARNTPLQNGWTGTAILSRFPITFSENKIISNRDEEEELGERRSLLHTVIDINNKQLHFYGTRLSADTSKSSAELNELLNIILDWGLASPIILCGDFNRNPGSKPIKDVSYYFYDLGALVEQMPFTYPAQHPTRRRDYIFMNDKLVPVSIFVIDNEQSKIASNHLPVLARFRIK